MNFVWLFMMIVSISRLIFYGQADSVFETMLAASDRAIGMTMKLWAIYAVWLGILKILEDTNLSFKLSKVFKPFTKRFIGKFDDDAEKQISLNLVSNIFGLGNASTPSGMKATEYMSRGKTSITKPVLIFFVLNTINLQLIPSTIIGLRTIAGSVNSNNIILPTILTSVFGIVFGLIVINVGYKIANSKIKQVIVFNIKNKLSLNKKVTGKSIKTNNKDGVL